MDLVERLLFPEIKRRLQKPYTVAEEGVGDDGAFLRIGSCVVITHDAAGERYGQEVEERMSEDERDMLRSVWPGPFTANWRVRVGDNWYGREVGGTIDAKTEAEWLTKAFGDVVETLEWLIEDFDQPFDDETPEADDERSLAMMEQVRREYSRPLFA